LQVAHNPSYPLTVASTRLIAITAAASSKGQAGTPRKILMKSASVAPCVRL
jgi:uncharacterized protein YycO